MEQKPKRLITRILEYAAIFALSALLIRLAVYLITEIWWVLLIIAAVTAIAAAGYRIWKNKAKW